MKRKIISILLILIMLLPIAVPAIAATYQEQKEEIQDKINEAEAEKSKLKAEQNSILSEIEELNSSINKYEKELEKLNSNIAKLEISIKEKDKEIIKLQEDFEKKRQLLEDRLVAIYEQGQITFLDVILSSESIWDYISMSSRIQELTQADNDQMDIVEKQRQAVEKAKKELEEQKTQLANDKKTAEAKAKQLKTTKSAKQSKVDTLTAEQKNLQEKIEDYNDEIDRIEEEIRKATEESDNHYQGSFKGTLSWPISSSSPYYNNITSYFGYREQPVAGASTYHRAIDIGVNVGTPIYSAADGYVVTKGSSSVRGIYVMVKHADNLYTFYQHLSSVIVSEGQYVSRGQQIARSGNTGIGSGPHLHFEVRTSPYYGSEVNPLNYTHW